MLMSRLGTRVSGLFLIWLSAYAALPVERLNIAKVLMFGNGGSEIVH